MELAIVLGIVASIIDVAGSALYIKDVLVGRCRPSITSWGLWSFLAILSSCSYTIMTGDWVKGVLPVFSTAACVGIFIFAFFKGNFGRLSKLDYAALAIGINAALVWWIYKDATYGSILLQPGFLIGYIPTYKNVWKDSKSEKPLPWITWIAAFTIQVVVVFLRWKGQYQDLLPISTVIACSVVLVLTLRKTKNG